MHMEKVYIERAIIVIPVSTWPVGRLYYLPLQKAIDRERRRLHSERHLDQRLLAGCRTAHRMSYMVPARGLDCRPVDTDSTGVK